MSKAMFAIKQNMLNIIILNPTNLLSFLTESKQIRGIFYKIKHYSIDNSIQ